MCIISCFFRSARTGWSRKALLTWLEVGLMSSGVLGWINHISAVLQCTGSGSFRVPKNRKRGQALVHWHVLCLYYCEGCYCPISHISCCRGLPKGLDMGVGVGNYYRHFCQQSATGTVLRGRDKLLPSLFKNLELQSWSQLIRPWVPFVIFSWCQ